MIDWDSPAVERFFTVMAVAILVAIVIAAT